MEDEATPDPNPAEPPAGSADDAPEAIPAVPDDDAPTDDSLGLTPELERRLRKLAGKNAPHRGPIIATTRGWVSRESRGQIFAARFLDFAVLTEEHLVLCSTGFFSRRPRRQVLREPLTRLIVTPLGDKPVRTLRVAGDFSRRIRMQLHDDERTDVFVKELLVRSSPDPRRRAEPWAAIGQLGIDAPPPEPAPTDDTPPALPATDAPEAQ